MADLRQPAFRARQLRAWLYERGAERPEQMSDLPAAMRAELARSSRIGRLSCDVEQTSSDGTRKRLYRLPDGPWIESVLMPYADGRRTACISTQAGCAMGCRFCATGQMGLSRHLDAGEILEQAWRFHTELARVGERLSNVVLMGMGEPFHNYDASVEAIRRLSSDLGIGQRHITVSTVGLAPGIRRFAEEGLQVTLAISLHASTDEERGAMLPINRKWPLAELLDACRYYQERTGRRLSFEWALISGENDREQDALQLAGLLAGLSCHVNLIPLNPTRGYTGGPSSDRAARAFVAVLEARGIPATIRVRRGLDIDAGCGQLRDRVEAMQA